MTEAREQIALRLFCAVELSADVRARAATHAARLRESFAKPPKVSWECEEKLHLTIKFFGDVAPARCDQLARAVGRAAARVAPFEARLEGAGVFPSASRPRVIWLGVADGGGSLASLQAAAEEECASENFPRDTRPFHPHVTLGRVRVADGETRRLARLHEEIGFEPVRFNVSELLLMRSELGARGSTYTALSRHALRG